MEAVENFKLVLAFICVTVFSLLFSLHAKKRRWEKIASSCCYLNLQSKPQCSFKQVLADNSYSPFKHIKPISPGEENASDSHPYEEKIKALMDNPPIDYSFVDREMEFSLDESYVWVGSEAKLQELADRLRSERIFAVDTEQHSLRSFLGFTALIQISTIEADYLVDTLALHDVMGILHPIFTDESICKVFHGADNDVLWLQRDFHLYVVNLFDTAKACDVLAKPQKSLAYLLESYCGVATNKLLQREDWRQRPLPDGMITYARTDAHFLLYIAECLISELKLQNTEKASADAEYHFVREASRRSNMICLQLYAKDIENIPGEFSASSIISRYLNDHSGSSPESHEIEALVRRICMWRDIMARLHDESIRYVLSDQAIACMAYKAPRTPSEIYDAISQADKNVDSFDFKFLYVSPSPVIYSHLDDLCELYKDSTCSPSDFFKSILQKCLGPKGNCPLSLYNYSMLSHSSSWPANRLTIKERVKIAKKMNKKTSRDLFVKKFSCKAPVYHNCRIYASDGRLLCYCDRKKLEWYLRRDLAEIVDENPPAIILLFEPKGRPEDEGNDFYVQSKKNICVGCGEKNHYLRYRIIPSCYRIHFPEHLKSHRSHDIVLLCVDCHELAHSAAEKYKKQVAAEYGVPLFVQKVIDSKTQYLSTSSFSLPNNDMRGVSPLQLRMAAMALLRHGQKMPLNRHEELTQTIMEYCGKQEISQEDLEDALLVGTTPHEKRRLKRKSDRCSEYGSLGSPTEATSTARLSLLGHGPHGKAVVDSIMKQHGEDGIRKFCQIWRQIFVEAIHPRFLPAGWDVMHSGRRDFGDYSVYNPTKRVSAAPDILPCP